MKKSQVLVNVVITEAKYIKNYVIVFKFSDGSAQEVNFEKWIRSDIGGCAKYLNKKLFKQFEIMDGKDISWNDFEMSFPFMFLYEEHAELELV